MKENSITINGQKYIFINDDCVDNCSALDKECSSFLDRLDTYCTLCDVFRNSNGYFVKDTLITQNKAVNAFNKIIGTIGFKSEEWKDSLGKDFIKLMNDDKS